MVMLFHLYQDAKLNLIKTIQSLLVRKVNIDNYKNIRYFPPKLKIWPILNQHSWVMCSGAYTAQSERDLQQTGVSGSYFYCEIFLA